MGRKSVWNIPGKSGTPEYHVKLCACKHFGKPWDQLTKEQQKWQRIAPANVGKRIVDTENRDDLYFLADALKMVADEMRALNHTVRGLVVEIRKNSDSIALNK